MNESGAIVCEELTKIFPNAAQPAVNRVNFQITSGELVVLLGPSGCGKTTLLKMINRLYEPSSGRILIEGTEVHELPVTGLRRRIGYVIQQVGLFPHMRIEQNIAIVPQLVGWEKDRIDKRVDELLDLVQLPRDYRKRHPRQLSGGEQQRVGLARALAADPAIMLMDEPFAAIDAIARTDLQDELLDIQRKLHKTILFVTHDVEEALRLADRIIVMRSGEIVQYDTPLQIITHPQNAFVQQLVGTEDMLRRLSLMRVEAILAAKKEGEVNYGGSGQRARQEATISPQDDLRSALSRLLASQAEALTVIQDDQSLGSITFDDLRAVIFSPSVEEKSGA
jgi:osmoprotectant transport system ATP-binding protein